MRITHQTVSVTIHHADGRVFRCGRFVPTERARAASRAAATLAATLPPALAPVVLRTFRDLNLQEAS